MATRRKVSSRRRTKADREFVSESEEILETMRGDLADLSDAVGAGGAADPERVNALFRSAHSLKALAGMFRFDPIETLAHRLEDVLDGMRLGRVALAAPLLALLEETVALFSALLERVGDAEAIAATEESIASLVARIEAAGRAEPESTDELDQLDVAPGLLRALTEYEEHRLRENLRSGRHIVLVEAPFEIASFEEGLAEITRAVRESGEVLSTLPAAGDAPESHIRFSLLVGSDLSAEALALHLEMPEAEVRAVRPGTVRTAEAEAPSAKASDGEADSEAAAPVEAGAYAELASLKSISDTVRVDIKKLDDLMNLVGELVIQRGAMGDLISRLAGERKAGRLVDELAKVHKGIDRKLRELQAAVLEVRMVPLRQVLEKVSRVVRRLRRELGKDVELDVRGADTELDKLIVEALVDPLMHVVRNALDHAIETPDERRAAGKSPMASIQIEAFGRGSHVVIAVRDDGRGIDVVRLREKAEEQGLVEPEATLSEKETLELIFAPGFSTRDEVTGTSGRGVGMDVVRANLGALGGVVDIDSTLGRGTTISMTLPITLAIIQSLIVGARGQRFAIPLNAVMETLVAEPGAVQVSEGREILNLRGEPLVLRRLADEFALAGEQSAERPFVIVVGIGDQRVGLLVDRLEGQQDTVIKPIQGPVQSMRGISGATDLGDRDPVLVLDVSALVEDAVRRREAA
jgi:two-component system chemotaxis sensor kinase CheA